MDNLNPRQLLKVASILDLCHVIIMDAVRGRAIQNSDITIIRRGMAEIRTIIQAMNKTIQMEDPAEGMTLDSAGVVAQGTSGGGGAATLEALGLVSTGTVETV